MRSKASAIEDRQSVAGSEPPHSPAIPHFRQSSRSFQFMIGRHSVAADKLARLRGKETEGCGCVQPYLCQTLDCRVWRRQYRVQGRDRLVAKGAKLELAGA
jgi:hypothetical protein